MPVPTSDLTRAIAARAATSLADLIHHARLTGRPVDCDPALTPPDLADETCDLADELERRGVPVTPPASVRRRRLTVALRRLRDPSPAVGRVA